MSRKMFVVVSLVVLASMVLTACQPQTVVQTVEVTKIVAGTSVVESKTVVVTATPVPPTAVPPTAAPKAADTVIVGMTQEPDTLHPFIGSMTARVDVLAPVMGSSLGAGNGCMGHNEKSPPEWIPLGCESVPTLDNGGAKLVGEGADKYLELTYKIKKGWRWTDGTPVTSKDAVYGWKLWMDPDLEVADRSSAEKLYDVSAVDDSTFVVKFMSENQAKAAAAGTLKGAISFEVLKADYGPEALNFGAQVGPVVDPVYWITWPGWMPEHILGKIPAKDQGKSDYAKKPLGDMAYVVKDWKQGQEIVLEKSDKPFLLGDAKIKTIIFRFFSESAAVVAALQKGEIDMVPGNVGGLSASQSPDLDKIEKAGKYGIKWVAGYSWEHIDLNTAKFPLDDVKVRQALLYGTDKKTLSDKLYFGKVPPVNLPGPTTKDNSWGYSDNYTKYPYDVEKAKALLKDAGWDCSSFPCTKKVGADTKNLSISLMTTTRQDRQALAQVLQQQWKAIGIDAQLSFLEGRQFFAVGGVGPLNAGTFDAGIYTWSGGDDPAFFNLYSCSVIPTKANGWVGQNDPRWCNKDADNALIQSERNADVTLSRDKRKPFIEKFFQAFANDVPVIPLYAATEPLVYRASLKNFKPGVTQYSVLTWNAWEWELTK
jgi:peptide/nickel transport system substrate-binding protein